MKDRKFGAVQIATVFVGTLMFAFFVIKYLFQQIFALEDGGSILFDDAFFQYTPHYMALMIALPVTRIISKIRNA
ncbi:hypothetical protein OKZ62_001864 [Vibrio navarrensis]|nr:hypothetical protein [Vibrio navarrensis]